MNNPLNAPILLVESKPAEMNLRRSALASAGFAVQATQTATEALRLFRSTGTMLVVLDLALPDRDGIDLIRELLALRSDVSILAMAPAGGVERAVAAMRAGAFDVLQKPFEHNHFLAVVHAAAEAAMFPTDRISIRAEIRRRRAEAAPTDDSPFIGSSEAMAAVHRIIASVAGSMATVFITGESGTGKELAALAVHAQSPRAGGPFIALNCGAIPPDLLESEVFGHVKGSFTGAITDKPGAAIAADGGTLFLDEVCEMAPALQTKLLRFLQTSTVQQVGAVRPRKVDVRIVCATNRDPHEAVRRGQFREDLFYRLFVVPLHMPPLRQRGADAVEIAEAVLMRFAEEERKSFTGFAPETRALLLGHDWPGNVRQLLNVIRNVVVLNPGGEVRPEMLPEHSMHRPAPLPPAPAAGTAPAPTLAQIERQAIEAALARHGGSVPRAARELDISASTLYRKLDAWGGGRRG